ncbi:hypothetical protein EAF00_003956 [Botryotinia globosa]|nr:hypothetical protein EAF00_003956 [Botryotinia globosa]
MSSNLITENPIILAVSPLNLGRVSSAGEVDPDETLEKTTCKNFISTRLFEVTSEMIENEYEAVVNMDFWTQASYMIEEQKKIQMEDCVKNDTIKISA